MVVGPRYPLGLVAPEESRSQRSLEYLGRDFRAQDVGLDAST